MRLPLAILLLALTGLAAGLPPLPVPSTNAVILKPTAKAVKAPAPVATNAPVAKAMSPKVAALQFTNATPTNIAAVIPISITSNNLTATWPLTNLHTAFFTMSSSIKGTYFPFVWFVPSLNGSNLTVTMKFNTTNQQGFFRAGEN